jgi:hypothetical protein
MIVVKTHGIKSGATDDLTKLGRANRLHWALPPLYDYSLMKKSPQDIDQYAILMPYQEKNEYATYV